MNISTIVAMGKKREIGFSNKLLWKIPEEMLHFKQLTMGHTLIMGRKTYESIGKPLPGRTTIILTSDLYYKAPGCQIVQSREEAIRTAEKMMCQELFICGGEMVYTTFMPLVKIIHLSLVDWTGQADAFFPAYNDNDWKAVESKKHPAMNANLAWEYKKLIRT